MKKIFFAILVCCTLQLNAQELNCQVGIVANQKLEITTVQKEILEEIKNVVYEFMNNTQWTKDKFTVEERVNCNVQIQIEGIEGSVYQGSIQIQSSRPGYNSNYNSTVFNFKDDDLSFTYTRGSVLQYAPNQFKNNLTAILAFYAYYVIGLDYDTFSQNGGTQYFTEAQNIVTLAQNSGYSGWKSNEKNNRNRYWIIDNTLHELFSPLRECNYIYHRQGIDKLHEDQVQARTSIKEAIEKLNKVAATRPGSVNLQNFLRAKQSELINLYSEADTKEKTDIVNILKRIDPGSSSKYQEILN